MSFFMEGHGDKDLIAMEPMVTLVRMVAMEPRVTLVKDDWQNILYSYRTTDIGDLNFLQRKL